MGYYSEVGLTLSKTGLEKFNKKLSEASEEVRSKVQELLSYADQHHADSTSGAEVWLWNWLKWYPDYVDVNFIESLLQELEYGEFRFIRIGEEYDDTEVQGGFWDDPFNLELTRSITAQSVV